MVLLSNYKLTYAGVPFVPDVAQVFRMPGPSDPTGLRDANQKTPRKHQPLADLIDEIDRIQPREFLEDFALPGSFPGRTLAGLAMASTPDSQPTPQIKLYSWFYPFGASRWSVFRGLATSSMVKAMLDAVHDPATGSLGRSFKSRDFIMEMSPLSPDNPTDDAISYTVTSKMFMLPPRPVAENKGFDGLFMVTLVDDRWWFQGTPVSLTVNQNTTWADLLSSLASALSIDLTHSAIPAVYAKPNADSPLFSRMENAAILLDAVAWNVGCVVVRNLNGSYQLQTHAEARAAALVNRGTALKVVRTAGGELFVSGLSLPAGDLRLARNVVLPATVSVGFPRYVTDDPVPHFLNPRHANQRPSCEFEQRFHPWSVDVTTQLSGSTFAGSPFSGTRGVGTVALNTWAKALQSGEADATPFNASGLRALAVKLASDHCDRQAGFALDETYPGTFAWDPEGLHDVVWTYSCRDRMATCRVMRGRWNGYPVEFQHAAPETSGVSTNTPRGVGGPSVALTVRDYVFSGGPTSTLSQTLLSGQMTATLATAAFLPTQNRWRGVINGETILFEGTSGGLSSGGGPRVNVVYRAVDGTVQPIQHNNGSTVRWAGDISYGTNLITHEKGQFVFPHEWTSGGIQGVNVPPQAQTVRVFSNTGVALNGVDHYSGAVYTYDTTNSVLGREELIWVKERSDAAVSSGGYYDGQFVGFSPNLSGKTAPVYLVNGRSKDTIWNALDTNPTEVRVSGVGTLEVDREGGVLTLENRGNGIARIKGVVPENVTFVDNHFAFNWEYADVDLTLYQGAVVLPVQPKVRLVAGTDIFGFRNPIVPARPVKVITKGMIVTNDSQATFFGLGNIPRGVVWTATARGSDDNLYTFRFADPDSAIVTEDGYFQVNIVANPLPAGVTVPRGTYFTLTDPLPQVGEPAPGQILILVNTTESTMLLHDSRSVGATSRIDQGTMLAVYGILLANFHATLNTLEFLLYPHHEVMLEYDAVIRRWRFITPPIFRGCAQGVSNFMRPGLVPTDPNDNGDCLTGCNTKYLDNRGNWSSPFSSTSTNQETISVVTDVSFDSATCKITTTKQLITFMTPCPTGEGGGGNA